MVSIHASGIILETSSPKNDWRNWAKVVLVSFRTWLRGGTFSGRLAVNNCFFTSFYSIDFSTFFIID